MEKRHVDPVEYEALIDRVIDQVKASGQPYNAVVGVSRGGLPLADALLARHITLQVKPMKLADWISLETTRPLMDARAGIDFLPAIGAALRAGACFAAL